MAGKTLINGTAYDISGGKTLVNGTAYSIAGGKTLIDGTAYDISFGVDLAALFSGMTVLATAGRNSSSTGELKLSFASLTNFQSGDTAYVISFYYGYMSISKITWGNSAYTILYQSSSSYGNIHYTGYNWVKYSHDGTDKTGSSANWVYGATLALVQFDQPEAKVDVALSALQYVNRKGRNTSSTGNCYIDQSVANTGNYIFVAYDEYFAINLGLGNASFETIYGNRGQNPSLLMVDSSTNNLFVAITSGNKANVYGCSIHVVQGG